LGDYTVVQGAGPIGLFTLQWARAAGAGELIVIEGSPARAELAKSLGATRVCAPGEEAETVIREGTRGLGADLVFECVGRPETIQTAGNFARRGGSVMIIGLSDSDATIIPGVFLSKEVRMDWSIAYQHTEFEQAMAMMVDGRVQVDLHTRKVGPSELASAFAKLGEGVVTDVKVLFDPRGA
jgi:threonine dehydrogenase-like Zn-dependent dehydrogenase